MRRRVRLTAEADRGLRAARQWLRQPGSGKAGAERWTRLRDAGFRLLDNPGLGTPLDSPPGARQLAVSGYRVVYAVDAESGDVLIATVLGPGQP